jgi:hypothetical protein
VLRLLVLRLLVLRLLVLRLLVLPTGLCVVTVMILSTHSPFFMR